MTNVERCQPRRRCDSLVNPCSHLIAASVLTALGWLSKSLPSLNCGEGSFLPQALDGVHKGSLGIANFTQVFVDALCGTMCKACKKRELSCGRWDKSNVFTAST